MPKMRLVPRARFAWERAVLFTLLGGLAVASASGQVVELTTSPIDRSGNPIDGSARGQVRQVQAQAPAQQPAQQPAPAAQPPAAQPPAATAPVPDQLNVDPNANINDIPVPPAPAPPPSAPSGASRAGLGATAGSFSSAPTMIGDFQGGGLGQIGGIATQNFSFQAPGSYIFGSPGSQNATIAYEVGSDLIPNDVFTTGLGQDLLGSDGQFDTFSILEPIPPSDAPTSPGPSFSFDGGSAVYAGAQPGPIADGDLWNVQYSYSSPVGSSHGGTPVPSPGVSVRRVKISENFSPEVRDRWFMSYSFFNDSFGGLGDISRFVPGFEKVLYEQLISFETRIPFAGTLGSSQVLGAPEDRSAELGNITLITKGVLLRSECFVWSGGLGVGLPTAEDTVVRSGGRDVIRIENETVFLQPFTGMLFRHGNDTFLQGYVQLDVAANGDPVFANLAGGATLPQVGKFNDSNLMHVDVSVSKSVYRNRCARCLKQVLANAELHYTGTIQDSDFVQGNNFTYTNLKRNFTIVNATFGSHLVMGEHVVLTPAVAIPLRSGLDEQFDYEAVLQLNYLH